MGPDGLGMQSVVVNPMGTTIGRALACDVVLASSLVSRTHASIYVWDGDYVVQDMGSTTGTRLNGEPVTGIRHLHDGDRLAFGDVVAEFRLTKPVRSRPGRDPSDQVLSYGPPEPDSVSVSHHRRGRRRAISMGREPHESPGMPEGAVSSGTVVFNPPEIMRQGRTERVEVGLARSGNLVDMLIQELRGRGDPIVEKIRTSALMTVDLAGKSFDISPLSPSEQLVAPTALWEFDIRPRVPGRRTLTVQVAMRVDIPGHPGVQVAIPVLERMIQVRVSVVFGMSHFVAANWRWLIATGLGLGGAISAWLALLH